ncbi:hypothetical protein [Bacillus sp. 1P02SD]|uniref:hypothetical protein n=1 Tax=Bacillus sp. 1P02SD TaxID=3132264 RepID=UPI00399FCF68
MNTKIISWKSYVLLTLSVLVTLTWFLLDPIAQVTNEGATGFMLVFILFGTIISLILAIVTFFTKNEKKLLPSIALILTLVNAGVIIFFAWFGANFA